MKNVSANFATTLILFLACTLSLHAQKIAMWKGGAPGRSSDWSCAANWREGRVPNEFNDVVIPDVSSASGILPVIQSPAAGINSLTILSGGQLRIETTGRLEVFGTVETYGTGNIRNLGELQAPFYDHNQDRKFTMAGAPDGQY